MENIRGIRCTNSVPKNPKTISGEENGHNKQSILQDLKWVQPNKLHPSTDWIPQIQYLSNKMVIYQTFIKKRASSIGEVKSVFV